MTGPYLPPGFNPYAPQATWDKDIFHGPFPRGGRRKGRARKAIRFALELLVLAACLLRRLRWRLYWEGYEVDDELPADIVPIIEAETSAKMICQRCEGQGWYPVQVCCGRAMNFECCGEPEQAQEMCPDCDGGGMLSVGIFEAICERHCMLCEGSDHHWEYDGEEDIKGNPVMGCRHCTAHRPMTDEDCEMDQ